MKLISNILRDYTKIFVADTNSKADLYDADYANRMRTFSLRALWRKEAEYALKGLRLATGARGLDVGCNNGAGTELLSEFLGVPFEGVDVSLPALRLAQSDFPQSAKRFHHYDGVHLPFDDAKFDLVCSMHVIGHVKSPKEFLLEILRVLKPGGHLIVITPNLDYKIFAFIDSILNDYNPDPTVLRYFSSKALHRLVVDCGYSNVVCSTFGEHPLLLRRFSNSSYGRIRLVLNAVKPEAQ